MKKEKIQPTRDNVLVEEIEEKKTIGKILIPEIVEQKGEPIKCKILSLGSGRWIKKGKDRNTRRPIDLNVGDIVLIPSDYKSEFHGETNSIKKSHDEPNQYIVKEDAILAILED